MADKVIIEAEVKSNIGELSEDASSLASEFNVMGVSVNGVKAGLKTMATTARASFATVKAGIMSTGIGALVIAVGSLISYFTKTKRGSEALARTMAGLGVIVTKITNLFSRVGEKMVKAFTDPKQAVKDLWEGIKTNLMNRLTGIMDGFKAVGKVIHGVFTMNWDEVAEGAKEYGQAIVQISTGYDTKQQEEFFNNIKEINKSMGDAIQAEMNRTKSQQHLTDSTRALNVESAQSIAWIEKQKLIAEDITKSYEERESAAKRAFAREKELETERIDNAELAVYLEEQRHKMLGEDGVLAADLDNLADKEVALANIRQESAGRQISLQNFLNGLRDQEKAAEQAHMGELTKLTNKSIDLTAKLTLADNKYLDTYLKNNKKKISSDSLVADLRKKLGHQGLNLLSALATEGTALAKGAAVAQATISGIEGVQNAYTTAQKSPYTVMFPGYPLAQAGIAAAFSAIQIRKILTASSAGGDLGGDSGGNLGGNLGGLDAQTPSPEMMSGAFTLSGGQAPDPVQAYVVTDDMTNNQNKLATIRRRATI